MIIRLFRVILFPFVLLSSPLWITGSLLAGYVISNDFGKFMVHSRYCGKYTWETPEPTCIPLWVAKLMGLDQGEPRKVMGHNTGHGGPRK